jgi:hypothetical protein
MLERRERTLPEEVAAGRRYRLRVRIGGFISALALLASAAGCTHDPVADPLRAEPSRLAAAPLDLQQRLREDPFVYFRFVNMEWASRVCASFRDELPALPPAMLHGDLHVGQYAITATARGLDDFDDAARGPSVIDSVRLLGSVDLIARRRGWIAETARVFDSFFDGYNRGLSNPAYVPSEPLVVGRVRTKNSRTRDEFLSWCESLMKPLTQEQLDSAARSLGAVAEEVRSRRPEIPAGFFRPKKMGLLRIGVGSVLARRILARVEGPSPSPADDVLLEAKELSRVDAVKCLQVPAQRVAVRVIEAAQQIGRIRHEFLLVVPRREGLGTDVRDWWVRSWDETYVEVAVSDILSAAELAELVHDVGAQLGATNLRKSTRDREAELAAMRRLAPRIRETAMRMTDALLAGWEELRKSTPK